MKRITAVTLTIILLAYASIQAQDRNRQSITRKRQVERPNTTIRKIAREISATNIEAIIRKLVSFHTRHTLSETESETRGIGAARRTFARLPVSTPAPGEPHLVGATSLSLVDASRDNAGPIPTECLTECL